MDLKASRETDEFGSVYSFDGLVNKIKKHNLVHPVSSPSPPPVLRRLPHREDFFSGHRGSLTGSNGDAVTGNGFRRFSVFSQPVPQFSRAPNGLYSGGLGNGGKLEGLSEGKGPSYAASTVALDAPEEIRKPLDAPEEIRKPRLSENPEYIKVGSSCWHVVLFIDSVCLDLILSQCERGGSDIFFCIYVRILLTNTINVTHFLWVFVSVSVFAKH
jgi:hypothetical protein